MASKHSVFENFPECEEDLVFGLQRRYDQDDHPQKLNLGVGAYRDEHGRPWVFPVVHKVEERIINDPKEDHEYLPIRGNKNLCECASKLVFGEEFVKENEDRIVSFQSLSGTGAVRLAAEMVMNHVPQCSRVYVSDPTWANHWGVFQSTGAVVNKYRYWDEKNLKLDFEGMVEDLKAAPQGSLVVFHTCAHNPTGIDPTQEQWIELANLIMDYQLLPLFDSAYLGFASGDHHLDAFAIRYFARRQIELLVTLSFAKNFGLYGERVGALLVLTLNSTTSKLIYGIGCKTIRTSYSNPPKFGALIVSTILGTPELYIEWQQCLQTISARIRSMRLALYQALVDRNTPGNWEHILHQIGMFSYTGIKQQYVNRLVEEFHIYLLPSGRISMAGLSLATIPYLADSIYKVLTDG